MAIILSSGNNASDFTPHPPGTFMAVCCDVFTKEQPNKYKGQVLKFGKNKGKPDERETITKVCIAFLTEEAIEIDGDLKPRYASYWASGSMGTAEYPSNVRKFIKGWWPSLTDAQIDEGFDLDKLIGKGAYLTITQSPDATGKIWANVVGAAQPPKNSTIPVIPADFQRHADKVQANGAPASAVAAPVEDDDLPF